MNPYEESLSMNKFMIRSGMIVAAVALAACEVNRDDQVVDGGFDGGTLKDGIANIWVSPDGCQYWYIDDGIEGYMAARLNRDGTPRCTTPEDNRTAILTKDGTSIVMEPEPRAQ